jgi:hypothetical protein
LCCEECVGGFVIITPAALEVQFFIFDHPRVRQPPPAGRCALKELPDQERSFSRSGAFFLKPAGDTQH